MKNLKRFGVVLSLTVGVALSTLSEAANAHDFYAVVDRAESRWGEGAALDASRSALTQFTLEWDQALSAVTDGSFTPPPIDIGRAIEAVSSPVLLFQLDRLKKNDSMMQAMGTSEVEEYFRIVYRHATSHPTSSEHRVVADLSFESAMEYWLVSRLIVYPDWSSMDPKVVHIDIILPKFCFFGIPWFSCD